MKFGFFKLMPLAMALVLLAGTVQAAELTGKVMAVYHEHVNVNNKWLDKVSMTLAPCDKPGQLTKVWYTPGAVSEDNALGFLFRDLAMASRHQVMKSQYMNSVNGHVSVAVNDQSQVLKTTFWGYNWECGRDIGGGGSSFGAGGGMMGVAMGASSTPSTPAAGASKKPAAGLPGLGGIRPFGF